MLPLGKAAPTPTPPTTTTIHPHTAPWVPWLIAACSPGCPAVYKKELGKTLKSLDAKKLGKAAKKSGKAAAALTAAGPCGCILLGVAAAGLALFVPLKALARTLKIVNGGEEAQYSTQLAAGAGVREGLDGEQGQQQYETYSRAVPQPAAASGSQGYAQLPMQYQQYPQQQLYQQQYQPISPGMPVMQTA